MTDDASTPADQVRVEVDGVVGRLTLSAPERLNAVAPDMLRAVARGVRRLDDDPAVRVIVLSGEGRAFSAGADLGVHVDEGDLDGTLFSVGAAVRAVLEAGTPVLSLVPGVAAGAGLSSPLGRAAPERLLTPDDVAGAVEYIVTFPGHGCPVLVELQPLAAEG